MIVTRSNVTLFNSSNQQRNHYRNPRNHYRNPRSAVFCHNDHHDRTSCCSAVNNQQSLSHNRRNDDGNDNRRNDTHSHVAAPPTLAFKSHAARQLCSPVLFNSHAARQLCSTILRDISRWQVSALALTYFVTIKQICLFDNCPLRQPPALSPRQPCAEPYIASAIAFTYNVTINQICLCDNCSMWQPTAFVSTTSICFDMRPMVKTSVVTQPIRFSSTQWSSGSCNATSSNATPQ